MYYKQEIGKIGEMEAAKYLENKGYKIIDRNFRCKTRRNRYYCIRKRRDSFYRNKN